MFRKSMMVLLATMLVMTAFLAACGGDNGNGNGNGDVGDDEPRTDLIWGVTQEADTLDPRSTTSAYAGEVFDLIFNKLIYLDGNLEIVNDLAVDIDIMDDGVTYVFEIRDDVKWHDGEALTAHDVVFTFETIMDPAFGSPRATRLGGLQTVTALNDHTIELVTEEPNAAFLYLVAAINIVPEHAAPAQPYGDEGAGTFAHEPIGSGPFKVIEWRPNDRMVLERNEDYHNGLANLERITRREIPEAEALFADLMAGRVDKGTIPHQEIDNVDANPDFTLVQDRTLNYFPVYINHDDPLFEDVRVRQALNKAADYNAIVNHIWPTSTRAYSPIVKGTWAYDEDAVRIYQHDPDAARQLLADAGFPDGIDVEIIMSSAAGNPEFTEMLKAQWAEAGINLTPNHMDFGTMLDRTNEGDYQLSSVGMVGMYDPDLFMLRFEDGSGAGNYNNPEFNEMVRAARNLVDDHEGRVELYSQMQRHLSENAVDIPLRNSIATVVWNSSFNLEYNYIQQYKYNMMNAYWD